jgi:hypothetical protein
VAKRVLIRLAEVLEGRELSINVNDTLIPQAFDYEDESEASRKWRLSQHSMFVQVSIDSHNACASMD